METVLDAYPLGSTTPCSIPTKVDQKVDRVGVDSVTYGENVPGWKDRIANGISATTTLTGLRYRLKAPIGTASWQDTIARCHFGSGFGQFTGIKLAFNDPGAGTSTAADNSAKSKLLSSVINAKTSWRGGNFFAEVGETLHMLRHPLQSFYRKTWDFAGYVKKLGKIHEERQFATAAKEAAEYARRLGDAWLAFGFGVKPLISDLNDFADAMNRLTAGLNFDVRPIKGHGHNTVEQSAAYVSVAPSGWAGDQWSSWQTSKQDFDVRYSGTLRAELDDGSHLFQHFGLSFDDFVPAVWEAIPWSFFIDYFTNTGEMLDSLRLSKVGLGWLKRTVRNSGIVQLTSPVLTSKVPNYATSISVGTAHSLVVRVNRVPLFELPTPDWHFKTPGWFSTKWINISALAAQFSGSKPPTGRLPGR
jgi:hypothetical protein